MSCTNNTTEVVCNFTVNEAEFTFEGETVHMEFHRWCGPIFTKKVYDPVGGFVRRRRNLRRWLA